MPLIPPSTMSTTNSLRRSTRERKQTQEYVKASPSLSKPGINPDEEDDFEDDGLEHDLDTEGEGEGDDEEPEYADPRPTQLRGSMTKPKRAPRSAPRKARSAPAIPKTMRTKAAGKSHSVKDASINDDNSFFNSLLNSAAALQSTVQDFLDSLEANADAALAELITCILRLCGCNSTVDSHVVVDSDGVVDFLGDLVEEVKEAESQQYPLSSKAPVFRKLRKSISEFLDRLIASSSENDMLFSTELVPTLQIWVIAMSSAQLRSFRHTATVVALELESALSSVAAVIEKEAEMINRQREGERKRRKGSSKPSERENALRTKAAGIKEKRTKMNEFLKEFFDGVFVHRYRDSDAGIRADCVREMGVWLKRHPGYFLEGNYLRYVGWVLSDANTNVRLEAVKSLLALYQKEDYLITLQHFTERFKSRLVAMAKHDTELSVRVAVIQVLEAIDKNALLDDDQRALLCLLIFDQEPRVRKAISAFVRRVWDETVAQRLVKRNAHDDRERSFAGAKALALLLVNWENVLAKTGVPLQSEDGSGTRVTSKEPSSFDIMVLAAEQKSRVALAIEALWDQIDVIPNWEAILQLLLLDHSGNVTAESVVASASKLRKKSQASPRKKRKGEDDEDIADEAWRLEETEETALLNVLLASLQKTLADSVSKKTSDADIVRNDLTRVLMKALPQLFSKHQTDDFRMIDILTIPRLLNANLYLEMRMLTAFEGLWDDISKQILTQSSPAVVSSAILTMMHLLQATALSATNSTKLVELDDELSSSLRAVVSGREEIEASSFHEDEVVSLAAITLRIQLLSARRDMSSWVEDDDNGKQSSSWDIILALAERGRLGHKEEDTLVQNCFNILTQYVTWKVNKQRPESSSSQEGSSFGEPDLERRNALLRLLQDYIGGNNSNASEAVKRTAFQNFVVLHILFPSDQVHASLAIKMDDRLQYQCAGFMQAEAERFHEDIIESRGPVTHENGVGGSDESGSESENGQSSNQKRGEKASKASKHEQPLSRLKLESEHDFISVANYFLRAIAAGVMSPRHSSTLLAYHGLLGSQFDHCLSTLVSVLREEGMFKNNGELVATIVNEALRQSFTMFMDGQTDSQACIGLAKAFGPVFVVRGAHLSITRRLDAPHVVEIHSAGLTWIIKRIAAYESSGNRTKKMQCIEFFRVLHALLTSVGSREASKIKSHLDKTLEASSLEIPPTSRGWDAARLYEKRLISAMSKDKSIVAKGRAAASKASARSGEGVTDDESLTGNHGDSLPPRPPMNLEKDPQSRDILGDGETDPEVTSKSTDQLGARPRPRMRPPPSSSPSRSPVRISSAETPARKRKRTPDYDRDDVSDSGDAEAISALIERQQNSSQKPLSQASQASVADFKSARKRARR
ncbi:uncharacterized protein EI90DRAFT_3044949 [Cantharellus anzutake]|uniref:uncharacterized protein n=1 Tax=Cantharellus anzutake TaxID=1750568 RepID=UPI001906E4BA|nr:uncharacterized protein EI90DRAFT_3044949 [Cantharellus anzutake]KAF8337116.1 hypothetical protein EI90DRAFT_3044949 [Cantharellus anzutake]